MTLASRNERLDEMEWVLCRMRPGTVRTIRGTRVECLERDAFDLSTNDGVEILTARLAAEELVDGHKTALRVGRGDLW